MKFPPSVVLPLIAAILVGCAPAHRAPHSSLSTPQPQAAPNASSFAYQLGVACVASNDWGGAIIAFSGVLAENPEDTWAYVYRAIAYVNKGDFDHAIGDLTKCIELDPSNGTPYCNRGSCFRATGQIEPAIRDLSEALRLCPTNLLARQERAFAYSAKGEFEKAIADYTEAIRLDRFSYPAHNGLAWLRATCPKAHLRDGGEAIAEATKACELRHWASPNEVDTLAAALAEDGEYEQAVSWQTKALQMAGLTEVTRAEMQRRLALYQQRQPFHEQPK